MLKKEVLKIMKSHEIGKIVRANQLIIALGNSWMVRNLGKIMRKHYTSSIMQLASQLKLQFKKSVPDEDPTLQSYLKPEHFESMCKVALAVAGQDDNDEKIFGAPQ